MFRKLQDTVHAALVVTKAFEIENLKTNIWHVIHSEEKQKQ